MFDYFNNLTPVESMYLYFALISTLLFIVQSVFTFLDLGDHFELDSNFDGHVDADLGHAFGLPFNLFSIRGIIGFCILFGWAGFLFSKSGDMNPYLVFIIAFLCGVFMLFVVALIYYLAEKLGENGNVDLRKAIGKEAEVYIPIPGNKAGTGKVSIILNDALKELEAVTLHDDLKSGDIVKVVEVLNDKLVVEKIN